MGKSMTLLQQAAEILKGEDDMVQLLSDKLTKLSQELEFDWKGEINYVITGPPTTSNDQGITS